MAGLQGFHKIPAPLSSPVGKERGGGEVRARGGVPGLVAAAIRHIAIGPLQAPTQEPRMESK